VSAPIVWAKSGEQPGECVTKAKSLAKGRTVPRARAYVALPTARLRSACPAREAREISVSREAVTPMLGGSTRTRAVDEVDIIRVATVWGDLPISWRPHLGLAHGSQRI